MASFAIRIAYAGKKVFQRIGKSYLGIDWIELCECRNYSETRNLQKEINKSDGESGYPCKSAHR